MQPEHTACTDSHAASPPTASGRSGVFIVLSSRLLAGSRYCCAVLCCAVLCCGDPAAA